MQTKLTLRLDKEVIDDIKVYALKHGKSLSDVTEVLYRTILNEQNRQNQTLTPIAKKYRGILRNKEVDIDTERLNYLLEKH